MTIVIDLNPEVRAELARRAAAQGTELGFYLATLLEEATRLPDTSKTLSQSQLDKTLQDMAQFSGKIPSMPDEALSRESLYRDHD